MPKKKPSKNLSLLLDEPISALHEEMIRIMEEKTGTEVPLERRSEEARGARLVEKKIRREFFLPPHKMVMLPPEKLLGAFIYMFDFADEKYHSKMTSLLYISRYFRQILITKNDK